MNSCGAPNLAIGTAERYAIWFDCNARLLGRDGFLGLASYSVNSGLLTILVTIFVALIGYRLLLGGKIDVAEGTGWGFRIGFVLALLAGWTAFQTLFYDLVITGSVDLSAGLANALGIPLDGTNARIQGAYDSLRIGLEETPQGPAAVGELREQPPLPITATVFLTVCVGFVGAAKLAAGFLLAFAPIPIMAMLFGPGMGFFVGWLRALIAATLAAAGLTLTAAMCLLATESEIARMQELGLATAAQMDEQAPMGVALMFFLISLAIIYASNKAAGGIAQYIWRSRFFDHSPDETIRARDMRSGVQSPSIKTTEQPANVEVRQTAFVRATEVSEAFERLARRESPSGGSRYAALNESLSSARSSTNNYQPQNNDRGTAVQTQQNTVSRRALGRRHRSSTQRDRMR